VGAVALACCLLLSFWIVRLRATAAAQAVPSVVLVQRPAAAGGPASAHPEPGPHVAGRSLGSCEQRIEHGRHALPTLAVVGASYTAGEGPGNPAQSWAVGLARLLHWNAVIYGAPGAGYVRAAGSGRGPMDRMLGQEQLRGLDPALVVVQAGHDDVGVPAGLERRRVAAAVGLIRSVAPGARIALLTTFSGAAGGTQALRDIDQAIVAAGTAADPRAIVMDPLAGRWQFPRAHDGLHPTAGGDAWIARTVAAILAAHGVRPASLAGASPVICDASVGVGNQVKA
jgi:lysophospholipase L1-like esterase